MGCKCLELDELAHEVSSFAPGRAPYTASRAASGARACERLASQ